VLCGERQKPSITVSYFSSTLDSLSFHRWVLNDVVNNMYTILQCLFFMIAQAGAP